MSHDRPQTQSTLANLGKRPNRHLTPTAHRVKERSLAGSRNAGRRIIQKGKLLPCSRVSLTYLNAKSPLARCRAHSLSRDDLPHQLGQAKAVNPSRSQNDGGVLPSLQLSQRVHGGDITHVERQRISSGSAFEERLGYSRAVRVGNQVWVAGTAPIMPDDAHWRHSSGAWILDMAMLAALSVFYLSFVRFKIRLKAG